MPLPRLATDAELDAIAETALRTLETVGFLYQDDELRSLVVAAGATEAPDGLARIPQDLVDRVLAPRRAAPEVAPDAPPRRSGDFRAELGCQIAQFYLDPDTGSRVPGTRELLAEMARFGEAWQEGSPVGPVLLCRDVPPMLEPMEAVLVLAENASAVATGYVHYAEQIPFLSDLSAILTADPKRFLHICIFAVTPLRLDRRACRLLVELTRRGVPVWIGTQPAAGASSPVTVAGTVALAVAEVIAGWVASYALDPEAMPGAGICSGVLDMRAADVSYCAPEAMLQDLLCVEVFRERLGGRCGVAGGAGYTDAKWPGTQKAFESAYEALLIYAYSGQGPGTGGGLLESGKTFSPVQFLLDQEMGSYLWRFARRPRIDAEALAAEAIRSVGVGIGESHLASDHTQAHWRELFHPRLFDRGCWGGDEAEQRSEERLLERARELFHDTLAGYSPTSVGEEKVAPARQVLERARASM